MKLNKTTIKDYILWRHGEASLESVMVSLKLKSNKILWTIVCFNPVDMMARFGWQEMPSNLCLYNKAMLEHVAMSVSIGMVGRKNHGVSFSMFIDTASPAGIFFANHLAKFRLSHFLFSFRCPLSSVIIMRFTRRVARLHSFALAFIAPLAMRFSVLVMALGPITRNFFKPIKCCFRMFCSFFHNISLAQNLSNINNYIWSIANAP